MTECIEPCPSCGGDASDNHFDRSLCASGAMHTCCNSCGRPLDDCPFNEEKTPIPIHDLVVADIRQRQQQGLATYGVALTPHNGRDALTDAYEESLDLACYLRQAIEERDAD